MITQLNPQIPMMTEKGPGQAVACIDYSEEHDLMWVVILDENGEVWTLKNSQVRGFPNHTMGRKNFANPFEKKSDDLQMIPVMKKRTPRDSNPMPELYITTKDELERYLKFYGIDLKTSRMRRIINTVMEDMKRLNGFIHYVEFRGKDDFNVYMDIIS